MQNKGVLVIAEKDKGSFGISFIYIIILVWILVAVGGGELKAF